MYKIHRTYRGADRITRRFEAAFSRYSVVFTVEELPDGTKADAVYIFLNEHYWKLLKGVGRYDQPRNEPLSAPLRPPP